MSRGQHALPHDPLPPQKFCCLQVCRTKAPRWPQLLEGVCEKETRYTGTVLEKVVPWWALAEQRVEVAGEVLRKWQWSRGQPQSIPVPCETVGRAMGEQRS